MFTSTFKTTLPPPLNSPYIAKMSFECGFNPYLKALDPACSIRAPAFFLKNFGSIHRAIRYNISLIPYTKAWTRSEQHLTKQIESSKQQTRNFHQACALLLCRRFTDISIKTPNLAALHHAHGSIISDYDFLHFFKVLEDTATSCGTTLRFFDPLGSNIPRPQELPVYL